MPKNLILCSDGTGNSGNRGYNTNVWRLFTAVNLQPRAGTPQVTFYDDGVGSEDYKFLRAIGGAFGWGISLNLVQLYSFLMLNYTPGDRIYLFGFSRGAFTIRTLVNMIRYCGIARCEGLSPNAISKLAQDALQAYKNRRGERCAGKDANGGAELVKFKEDYGQDNGETPASKHIPIEFVGVWDTVEALGLPIDELKHGLDHWFRLQFHDGENDMHPRIKHAYHALSIDDERLTFHPTLWDESFKEPGQIVEQVWFAGAHANVGGGYPKDQMSLVPLNWMMKKAFDCGLEFHQDKWEGYQRDQDANGPIYDPRAGLGMYYRYAPRDIRRLSVKYNVIAEKPAADDPRKVRIHVSALQRIRQATDDYAPTGLPEKYLIDPPGTPTLESNSEKRHHQLRIVRDIAWWRRILYYLMLVWTLGLVVFCATFAHDDKTPDFGAWNPVTRGLYFLQDPLIDLAALIAPDWAAPYLNALRHYPYTASAFLFPFAFFFWRNWMLKDLTRNLSVRAWHMSLTINPPKIPREVSKQTWWIRFARKCRDNVGAKKLVDGWDKFLRAIGPWITRGVVALGSVALLVYAVASIVVWVSLLMNPTQTEKVELEKHQHTEFLFDTRNSRQATPVWVEKDTDYYITVKVIEPWTDNGIPTDPEGFVPGDDHKLLKWMGFTRRDPEEKWFTLMAQVGADSQKPIALGKSHVIRPDRPGRLYLFVNDTYGFYHNNTGTATIRVKYLRTVN